MECYHADASTVSSTGKPQLVLRSEYCPQRNGWY